ncbi:hypothetical protein E2493_00285 [Sphingomonas parva]|uniref:Uncharacterized protein n=1 Tax=Sphingomonas parva TaxID=2555898 RepID=A0A4Y8ZYU9_9SPHN|nr:hypothetical protein [Sphingomonas parva]TFI60189.1 hypothetical protein E2493_00285 [Sphingomonas parva]
MGSHAASLFAPDARRLAGDLASAFVAALFRSVAPVHEIRLIAERAGQRTYHVAFARKAMTWVVSDDTADRIAAIRPE